VRVAVIAVSPRGDLLAVGGSEGEVSLYELPDLRLRWSHSLDLTQRAHGLEFTRQGDEMVAACSDGVIRIYNLRDGGQTVACRMPQLGPTTVSIDARYLAASCRDRAIRIWDRRAEQEVACLRGHDGTVDALAFAPDGQTLASGTSTGSLTLWHVASWQELGTYKVPMAAINDVVFSADGRALAMGGRASDGTGQVVLWKTRRLDQQVGRSIARSAAFCSNNRGRIGQTF
jgi:WD40 repeat protein